MWAPSSKDSLRTARCAAGVTHRSESIGTETERHMSANLAWFEAWQRAERRVIALRAVVAAKAADDPTLPALKDSIR